MLERSRAVVKALRPQLRRVSAARNKLGGHLDEIETRLLPGNVGKVVLWWAKREAKKNPLAWTAGGVALGTVLIGLLGWAIVDDSED